VSIEGVTVRRQGKWSIEGRERIGLVVEAVEKERLQVLSFRGIGALVNAIGGG
jgi:hypothetical protein